MRSCWRDVPVISPRSGSVPFYSAVTGGAIDTAHLDAGYWYRNLRETVQFECVTRRLLDEDYRTFIEVSPHPVLTVGMHETVENALSGRPADGIGKSERGENMPAPEQAVDADGRVNTEEKHATGGKADTEGLGPVTMVRVAAARGGWLTALSHFAKRSVGERCGR